MKILDPVCLDAFRHLYCEWCRSATPRGATPHYYFYRKGMGCQQLDHPYNLVGLCSTCHDDAQLGQITKYDFLALVAAREQKLQGEIEDELRRLRRLKP